MVKANAGQQPPKIDIPITAIVCKRGEKKDNKKKTSGTYHPYYITEVTLDNPKAPVSGRALYIVIEESNHQVTLLYPWSLSKFTITANEFIRGQGFTYWPLERRDAPESEWKADPEKFAARMVYLMEDYSRRSKQYSSLTVRSVIAAFRGVTLDKVPLYKSPAQLVEEAQGAGASTGGGKSPKKPRPVALKSTGPKKPGVIETIKEIIRGGATEQEILQGLTEKFPERRPDSMATTIKCQVKRDLLKKGLVIERKQVKGRGEIFTWTNPPANLPKEEKIK